MKTRINLAFLKSLFSRARGRPFGAWQIELTTRCPLRCRMCIRSGNASWHHADMDIERFRALAPYFRDVESAVLEGWGETLLYPHLVEAVRIVKEAGTAAGFVTSGWGLDANRSAELVEAGLDFMGFSVAGATPATHDAVRINSSLDAVLAAVEEVRRAKTDRKALAPSLHFVFLMVRDNYADTVPLIDLAGKNGIDTVLLINLVHVADAWQDRQRMFVCSGEADESVLIEANARAMELGVKLRRASLSACDIAVCEENPLRNLCISVNGEVTPCVFLCPPVPSPFKRIYCGTEVFVPRVSFGNIFEEPFEAIWNDPRYVAFRDVFSQREKSFREMYSALMSDSNRFAALRRHAPPPPPEPCRTCHKMLGV